MREQITFFDFFESFVPPRELRLLFHDAVVTGGSLDRKQRALELDVATGERIPEASSDGAGAAADPAVRPAPAASHHS